MKRFSAIDRPDAILIADDDRVWRTLVSSSLQKAGFTVLEAEDGLQAIDVSRTGVVDLAILDIEMPGMSGIEVAGRIGTPTLFLSLHDEPDIVNAALTEESERLNVIGYVVKSGDIDKLLPTIRAALRTAHQIAARKELLVAIARSREKERRELALALHDELGQHLVGILFDAEFLSNAKSGDLKEIRRRGERIKAGIKALSKNVHRLLNELRPESLQTLGLRGSVSALVDQWRGRLPEVAFNVEVDDKAIGLIDDDTSLCIYRLIQEGLTNIAKHAKASKVLVRLGVDSEARAIIVEVQDNGVGFDAKAQPSGLGLQGLSHRLAALGGQFSIESQPTKGTTVTAFLPTRPD